MAKTILILGGYGTLGFEIARLLYRHTDAQLILAGRNARKAATTAMQLNASALFELGLDYRVSGEYADSADADSLRQVFAKADLAIIAAPIADMASVAQIAIETATDCLDVQISSATRLAALRSQAQMIAQAGRCFITEAGLHPGLPGVLMRYAALQIPALRKAKVGAQFKLNWAKLRVGDATWQDFLRTILDADLTFFRQGYWQQGTGLRTRSEAWRFDLDFAPQTCYPQDLAELRELPTQYQSLRECGFFVAGFAPVVDYLLLPLAQIWRRLRPQGSLRWLAKALALTLRVGVKPPYGCVMKLDANGGTGPEVLEVHLRHDNAYEFTASAIMAVLFQYLDGSLCQPGLHLQALVVEPTRFLDDLAQLGVGCTYYKNGYPFEPRRTA